MKINTVEKNKKFLPLIIGGIITIVFMVMIGISIYLNNVSMDMTNGEYIAPIGILLIVLFTARIFTRFICFTIHSMMINECNESDIKFLNALKTIKDDPLHEAYKEYLDLKLEIEQNVIGEVFSKNRGWINSVAMITFGLVGAMLGYSMSKEELETWEIITNTLMVIGLICILISVYGLTKYGSLSAYYSGVIHSIKDNDETELKLLDNLNEYHKILSEQLIENTDLLGNISKAIEMLEAKDEVNSQYISMLLEDLDKRKGVVVDNDGKSEGVSSK